VHVIVMSVGVGLEAVSRTMVCFFFKNFPYINADFHYFGGVTAVGRWAHVCLFTPEHSGVLSAKSSLGIDLACRAAWDCSNGRHGPRATHDTLKEPAECFERFGSCCKHLWLCSLLFSISAEVETLKHKKC
jgi:hypothetical protein